MFRGILLTPQQTIGGSNYNAAAYIPVGVSGKGMGPNGYHTNDFATLEDAKDGIERAIKNYASYLTHGYEAFIIDVDRAAIVAASIQPPKPAVKWQEFSV